MHIEGDGNGYGDVDEYGGDNDDDNDGSNVDDSNETIIIKTIILNKDVNLPGLLSLCSSYISYSYFLRVPVIFANLRVNISHNNPNITGSWKKKPIHNLSLFLSIYPSIYLRTDFIMATSFSLPVSRSYLIIVGKIWFFFTSHTIFLTSFGSRYNSILSS